MRKIGADKKPRPKPTYLADVPKADDETLMEIFYGGVSGRPDKDRSEAPQGVVLLRLDQIVPDPNQPRKTFDSESIDELAQSIQAHGQLQPVLVRPDGERYILIAGERRWRACKLIERPTIEAKIVQVDAAHAFEIALTENVQRNSLLPIEEAQAYERIMDERSLSQADLARRLGVDRRRISEKLALLRLPAPVLDLLSGRPDSFTESHAQILVGAPPAIDVAKMAVKCAEEGWSMRRLRQAVRQRAGRDDGPRLFQNLHMALNRRGGFTLTVRARSRGEVMRTIEEVEKALLSLRESFHLSGPSDPEKEVERDETL